MIALPSVVVPQWEALPESAPETVGNPTTPDKVELGKMLYFDPRLSSNGTVSCFSCHNVMEGGDDHRPTSIGVHGQAGGRNAPTVWNSAFLSTQFWDGRAATLEEQAKGPPANPIEMGMADLDATADRIRNIPGYKVYFDRVFGAVDSITIDNIARAIAAYERTLITPNSAFDQYVKGDKEALTEQQVRGMESFAASGCIGCHSGANFAGPPLPEGQGFFQKFPTFTDNTYVSSYKLMDDVGRMNSTQDKADKNVWRVPGLRNLVYTAPYMHNGSVKTMAEAVAVMGKTQLNLDLNEQSVKDMVVFLTALTGEFPEQKMPRLPPTPGDLLE
jgi:cytochrome c peroxidase